MKKSRQERHAEAVVSIRGHLAQPQPRARRAALLIIEQGLQHDQSALTRAILDDAPVPWESQAEAKKKKDKE